MGGAAGNNFFLEIWADVTCGRPNGRRSFFRRESDFVVYSYLWAILSEADRREPSRKDRDEHIESRFRAASGVAG
jgi:hypothetical protein